MKKTDIAMIVLIASLSAIITYAVIQATPIGKSVNQSTNVKTIDAISADVDTPDNRIFTNNSINPSVQVTINNASTSLSNGSNTSGQNAQ
jgi:hypothetical protein